MSDVTITPQLITRDGITPSYTSLATTNTYKIANDGKMILHFKKTGAGDATITLDNPQAVDGEDVPDKTITVPATTGDKMWGPFPPGRYNQPGTGYIEITTSEDTDLSMAAVRL